MAGRIYPLSVSRSSLDLLPKRMAWLNQNTYSQSVKPLLWCMKIVGLLPGFPLVGKVQDSEIDSSNDNNRAKSWSGVLYRIYCVVVVMILLYNLAVALMAFKGVTEFNGTVCNQTITSMWFFQIAYCGICNYYVCKHMKTYCSQFDIVATAIDFRDYSFVRKCSIAAAVFYIVWLFVAFTFTGLGLYFAEAVPGPMTGPVSPEVEIVFWILFLVVYFYFTSTWYLIVALFSVTSIVLTKAFKHYNRSFRECFENGKFKGDIENKRFQHEQLSRLIGQADKVFCMYVMSTIGTVIPMIIFTLYFLLFESVAIFSYIATFWSAFLSITQLLIIFLGGGIVNHEVSNAFYRKDELPNKYSVE